MIRASLCCCRNDAATCAALAGCGDVPPYKGQIIAIKVSTRQMKKWYVTGRQSGVDGGGIWGWGGVSVDPANDTPEVLSALLAGCGLVALFAYGMWAAALPAVHGIPWRPLTVIPFGAGLLRYVLLVRAGAGETPEELVLGDRLLALAGLSWLVLFALGVHAAG